MPKNLKITIRTLKRRRENQWDARVRTVKSPGDC